MKFLLTSAMATRAPFSSTAWLSSGVMCLQHMGHVKELNKCFHDQTPLLFAGSSKQRPSRVQSLVSSQGSMDSDHLGESLGARVADSVQPETNRSAELWRRLYAVGGVTP